MNLLFILSVIALAMLPCIRAGVELSKSGAIDIRRNFHYGPSDVDKMNAYFPLSNWLECPGPKVNHGTEVGHGTHKPQPKQANKRQRKHSWFKMPTFTQFDSIFNRNHQKNHKRITHTKLGPIITRINTQLQEFRPEHFTAKASSVYSMPSLLRDKYITLKREIAKIEKDLQDIYKTSLGKEKAEAGMIIEDLHTGFMYIEASLCQLQGWLPAAKEAEKIFCGYTFPEGILGKVPLVERPW